MNQGHKTSVAALVLALCVNSAIAIQVPNGDAAAGGPDSSALMEFYGVSLSTSPAGVAEDKAVWLAKVQGLIAQAPPLFQQSILASKTKAEFAANLAILEQMQKGTLESSANAVKGLAASGKLQPKGVVDPNLGADFPFDLVYTPLAPCRIMDTRNASGASGVQGPLAGNTLYHIPGYITFGQNWSQYGQLAPLSDCGLNSLSDTWATAIVITILHPNFDAYLGVSDSNTLSTVLSNVALNFTHGQGLSTMYIVPQISHTLIFFAMPAGLSAHVIFDVVGYFAPSRATLLDCASVTNSVALTTANTLYSITATCAPGRVLTGGGCYFENSGSNQRLNVHSWSNANPDTTWLCAGKSDTAGDALYVGARCCRVPGR